MAGQYPDKWRELPTARTIFDYLGELDLATGAGSDLLEIIHLPRDNNCTCSTSSALTYVKQQRNQQNVTHSSDVRTIYVGYSMMMHHLGRHSTDRVIAGAGDATGVDTGRSVELSLCVLVRSTFTNYLTGPAL